jgi:hypothetical protein
MSHEYQVCLHVGERPELRAFRFADVTPSATSSAAILDALSALELNAADLRARTLFVTSPSRPDAAVLAYAALIGFAGRRLDFSDSEHAFEAASLHNAHTRLTESLERPAEPDDYVQVGAPGPDGVPFITAGTELTSEQITMIRYAKRLRLYVGALGAVEALSLLIAVAALRQRGGADRLPLLVTDPLAPLTDEGGVVGVDLDLLRRSANELRRSRRIDARDALVEPIEETPRIAMLRAAAGVAIEDALVLLGSHQDETSGYWRCPRPDRHRNGDANPSLKVTDGKVRCYRCDTEPVDSLRLVIDTLGCSPDDAARALTTRQ